MGTFVRSAMKNKFPMEHRAAEMSVVCTRISEVPARRKSGSTSFVLMTTATANNNKFILMSWILFSAVCTVHSISLFACTPPLHRLPWNSEQ